MKVFLPVPWGGVSDTDAAVDAGVAVVDEDGADAESWIVEKRRTLPPFIAAPASAAALPVDEPPPLLPAAETSASAP